MKFKFFSCLFFFFVIHENTFSQSEIHTIQKFSKADTLRGFLSVERSCYDVLFYDLEVKVDLDNQFISGKNGIRFIALNDFEKLQLDLFENLEIEKIEYQGKTLDFKRELNAVFVLFPAQVNEPATFVRTLS